MRIFLSRLELLSQACVHQIVVVLVLLILKVYLFTTTLLAAISGTKPLALTLCYAAANALEAASNIPAQLSLFSDVFVETVEAETQLFLGKLVYFGVEMAKGMVTFALEIYLGTYACLCTAFFKAILAFVADVAELVTDALNTALSAVVTELNSALGWLTTTVASFLAGIEDLVSFFSGSDSASLTSAIEKVNLTVLSISNITLPTSYISTIANLSEEVPDFEDVIDNFASLLSEPLDLLAEEANYTVSVVAATVTAHPVTSSDACSDVNQKIDAVITLARKTSLYIYVGLGVTTALAVVGVLIYTSMMASREHNLRRHLSEQMDATQVGNVLYSRQHRLLYVATRNWDPRLQWLVAYCTTSSLLKCLLMAACGFLVVGLQYLILRVIEKGMAKALSVSSSMSLEASLLTEFARYLEDTQDALDLAISEINANLYSSVGSSATSILLVIDSLQATINNTITSVFGGTVFATPLRTVVYCTIGRKLDSIESGLDWVSNNLNVTSPSLNTTLLQSVSDNMVSNALLSSSSYSTKLSEGFDDLASHYKQMLKTELLVASAFLGVWVLFLCIGLILLLVRHLSRREDTSTPIVAQVISWPTQMTDEEKKQYGQHFSDPYKLECSSHYTSDVSRH